MIRTGRGGTNIKTLYIDNSILNLEKYWQPIMMLIKAHSQLRVVISDWHMVELASGTDRIQAFRRAHYVDSLKPLWMHGSLPIQKQEVKRFTWRYYYGADAEEVSVFTDYLSEVWSVYLGPQTVIGLNATRWVAMVGDLSAITSVKVEQTDVLKTLQAASLAEKKVIEHEAFLRWILPRIDDHDPDQKPINPDMKLQIAKFCHDHRNEFYTDCPAMAVECSLHDIRSRDSMRQPRGSDAIDLHHGILALSYCDYYVTRDGFARHCALYVKDALVKLCRAEIYQTIDDLAYSLSA